MDLEGTHLNIVKAIYNKPTVSIILNCEKLKAFPLKSGTRHFSTFITVIQHSFGSPSYRNQRRKVNKRNPGWKRSKALTFCRWHDMDWYIENPKDSIRKLLDLISEFSKVAGYKISTQKPLAFLNTNNKKSEKEIRNQSHSPPQEK